MADLVHRDSAVLLNSRSGSGTGSVIPVHHTAEVC